MAHTPKGFVKAVVRESEAHPAFSGTLQIFIYVAFNPSDDYKDDEVRMKQMCIYSRRCASVELAKQYAHNFMSMNLWMRYNVRVQYTPFPVLIDLE
jgi:hypothetical protein